MAKEVMAGDTKIAVIMACHNRCAQTVECLSKLEAQGFKVGDPGVSEKSSGERSAHSLSIYLVDDASTDGTGDVVAERFPYVNVIAGSGQLYWCGGMRKAWATAAEKDYDFYLWLNDDTMLKRSALSEMFEAERECTDEAIVVGACCDPETGIMTYGGMSEDFSLIQPTGEPMACESFHGNTVLVPRMVYKKLGGFNEHYQHSLGDVDYAERARKGGIKAVMTRGFVAECKGNGTPSWKRSDLSFRARWKALNDPKGCPPNEYARFFRLKHGWKWPLVMAKMYWTLCFPPRAAETPE